MKNVSMVERKHNLRETARDFTKRMQNILKPGNAWRAFLLVLLVCSTLLFSACGKKVASEAKLQEDLYNSDAFLAYREKEFEITDLVVTKRQTAEEDRSDKVWVKVSLSNAKAEGYLSFVLDYSLYNDGWQMDAAQLDNEAEHEMKPLCGLSEEELCSDVIFVADADIISNDVNLESGIQTFSFKVTSDHKFCAVTNTVTNVLYFDSESGLWTSADSWSTLAEESWKTGQYSLSDIRDGYVGNTVGELYIHSLDGDSISYSYSTSFEDVEGSGDNLSLIDVSNMTITDYYNQGYGSFYHKYGYTETLMNANWSDIKYVKPTYAEASAPLFIGYDHIYLGENVNKYDERTDTKYIIFPFEVQ